MKNTFPWMGPMEEWPRERTLLACSLVALLLGLLDYATGPDLLFTTLYLIPVGVSAWAAGATVGAVTSAVAAFSYFLADLYSRADLAPQFRTWNAAVHLSVFLTLALLLSSLRERLVLERQAHALAEQAVSRLRAVQLVTDGALAHLKLGDLLNELLGRIQTILGSDTATLLLLDPETEELFVRATTGLIEGPELRIPVGRGVAGRIAGERRPLTFEDLRTVEVWSPVLRENVRSLLGVPLVAEGLLIGVLHVGSRTPRRFTGEEAQFLQLAADRVALATDRARLFDEVTEGRERLRAVSRRIVEAEEMERKEVARELHDEIGQVLTALKIGLGSLASREGSEPMKPRLQELSETVDGAIEQVRSLSLNLRPSLLDDLGLVAALRWYLNRVARDTPLDIRLETDDLSQRLPFEVETAGFRLVQEAVTNVLRHAKARSVSVTLRYRDSTLEIRVRDDGQGFDLAAARQRSAAGDSLGLSGMQERVALLGGRFRLDSSPGQGTEIRARFPAAARAAQDLQVERA